MEAFDRALDDLGHRQHLVDQADGLAGQGQ